MPPAGCPASGLCQAAGGGIFLLSWRQRTERTFAPVRHLQLEVRRSRGVAGCGFRRSKLDVADRPGPDAAYKQHGLVRPAVRVDDCAV